MVIMSMAETNNVREGLSDMERELEKGSALIGSFLKRVCLGEKERREAEARREKNNRLYPVGAILHAYLGADFGYVRVEDPAALREHFNNGYSIKYPAASYIPEANKPVEVERVESFLLEYPDTLLVYQPEGHHGGDLLIQDYFLIPIGSTGDRHPKIVDNPACELKSLNLKIEQVRARAKQEEEELRKSLSTLEQLAEVR